MTQRAVARDCVAWLRRRAKFKSTLTNGYMNSFALVETPEDKFVYQPLSGFTGIGLGVKRGSNVTNLISRFSEPLSAA